VQKLSGDAAVTLSGRTKPCQADHAHAKTRKQTQAQAQPKSKLDLYSIIAKQGNQGSRKTFAKTTARGKVPNEVRLEKPVAPLTESAACRKFVS